MFVAVLQAADIAPYENIVRPVEERSFPTSPTSCHGQKRKHSDVQQGPVIEDDLEAEEAQLLEKLNFIESLRQSEAEKLRSQINQVRAKKAAKRPKVQIKEEPKTAFVPGEVIDLTWSESVRYIIQLSAVKGIFYLVGDQHVVAGFQSVLCFNISELDATFPKVPEWTTL